MNAPRPRVNERETQAEWNARHTDQQRRSRVAGQLRSRSSLRVESLGKRVDFNDVVSAIRGHKGRPPPHRNLWGCAASARES